MAHTFAPRREIVKPKIRVSRQYAVAANPAVRHVARMKDRVERRQERLRAFVASFGDRKRNWICRQSGASESALRAFENGESQSLEEKTYDKLSEWSGWTVAELKGDAPIPSRQDILSRKTGTQQEQGNDSLRRKGQDTHKTADGPNSEEDAMPDRLFVEIMDRIDSLPPAYVSRLRRYLDRIDKDASARPPKAGEIA
jgi:hypothetical protein